MKLTIVRDDGIVGIDGVFRKVSMTGLPAGVRAVQYSSGNGGHVEYDDKNNTTLEDIGEFQSFIDAWNALTPPPLSDEEMLSIAKRSKLAEINANCQTIADQLTSGYPEFEKQTWPDQEREALAWDADKTVATPRIDAIAGYRGIERTLHLQSTLAKAKLFIQASNYLAGTRQKYVDQVAAAQSAAQVNAIVPIFTLS